MTFFWIITFISSGALLILLIVLKMIQDRFRVLLFWPDARERIEQNLIHKKTRIHKHLGTFSIKNFYILLHFVIVKLKKILARLHAWLDKKSFRVISLIRGRQHLETNKEKVSYFLHDIANFRDRFNKNKRG